MKPMIRLFSRGNMNDLENEVNDWLMSLDKNHNKVIDIKLSSTENSFDILIYIETGV